jgi:hypothetical protein
MVRIASRPKSGNPQWHQVFLKMAPAIERHARLSFRHLRGEARAEAIQNALCNACVVVERLDKYDAEEDCWREAVVEDPHTPDFEQVWFRCDFPVWLGNLRQRDRRIAQALSVGHRTGEVARRFKVSQGRISQTRRELATSWARFQGELPEGAG